MTTAHDELWEDQFAAQVGAMDTTNDPRPWVTVQDIDYCCDCRHTRTSHSRPDPEGILGYGMGSCGNCTACLVDDIVAAVAP